MPSLAETPLRRRTDISLALFGWVALVVFIAITVLPGLLPGNTFLGTDLMNSFAPWTLESGTTEVTNVGIGDTIDQYASAAQLIVDSAKNGTFPQWDPFNSGGAELAALPNTAMLSPLSLPWWILPYQAAPAAVKVLEITTAALGLQLLLRSRWRLPRFTVPLSTLIFVSSGFMVAWTNWPQTRVASLIPLFFWATDRLAVRHRWSDVPLLGLIFAAMLLGGFPAVTGYTVYMAAAFFFVRSFGARSGWRAVTLSTLRSAAGLLLGLGLAAIQMLPFLWFATHYVDFESRASSVGSHLPASTLSSTIEPFLLGFPNHTYYSWDVHFIEGFSYIGMATLVLILATIVVRRSVPFPRGVVPFFVAVVIICGAAMYFGGFALTLVQALPGVSSSPIGRVRSIVGFAVAVLAALGAAALFEPRGAGIQFKELLRHPRGRTITFVTLGLISALAIVIPILVQVRLSVNPDEIEFSHKWIFVTAAILVASGTAAIVTWARPSLTTETLTAVLLVVVTAIPATVVGLKWWPVSDESTFYPETQTHQYLRENLGDGRYASVEQAMLPGTSTAYQLRSLTGHAFVSPQWKELLEAASPGIFLTPTYSILRETDVAESGENPILDRLGVDYLVQSPSSPVPGTSEQLDPTSSSTVLSSTSGSLVSEDFLGPARGVTLSVLGQEDLPEEPGLLTARALSSDGQLLAETTSRLAGISSDQNIALDLDEISEEQVWHVELSLSDTSAFLTLGATSSDQPAMAAIRPTDDGLSITHTGDSTVIERETSLDRIRWASQSIVSEDPTERLSILSDPATPTDTVVLEHSADDRSSSSDSQAELVVSDESTDSINITAKTTGSGWIVIEDPMRSNGWSATLNDASTTLFDADHAGVAVYIPAAGEYSIVLDYSAPYFVAGTWVSAFSLALLAVWAATWTFFALRRNMTRRFVPRSGEPPRRSTREVLPQRPDESADPGSDGQSGWSGGR